MLNYVRRLSKTLNISRMEGCRLPDTEIIDVNEEEIKLLIFQLGEHYFAFYGQESREVLPYHSLVWFPGATDKIPGVIYIRGDIAAIIDISQFLHTSRHGQTVPRGFFIMLKTGDGRSGVWVDQIVDVLDVPLSAITPLLPTLDENIKQFAVSQFTYQNKVTPILSADMLVERAAG